MSWLSWRSLGTWQKHNDRPALVFQRILWDAVKAWACRTSCTRAHTRKERARRLLCLSYILSIALHTQHFHAQLFHTQLFSLSHTTFTHHSFTDNSFTYHSFTDNSFTHTGIHYSFACTFDTPNSFTHTAETTLSHTTLVIIDPPPPPLSFLPSPFRCNFYIGFLEEGDLWGYPVL